VGIALRRRAVASYMRRLQYLRRRLQLSIENAAAQHVVGPHSRIGSYQGLTGRSPPCTKERRPAAGELADQVAKSRWLRLQCANHVFAVAPARKPQIGVEMTVLSHDDLDLVGAARAILEIGEGTFVRRTIPEAFVGWDAFRKSPRIAPAGKAVSAAASFPGMPHFLRTTRCGRPVVQRSASQGTRRF
jgi:hypothetical protein